MAKQELIPVEQARALLLDTVNTLETEKVPLIEALGRISAKNQTSDIDISPFDHSAMDGFAVVASDLANATPEAPIELPVIDEIPAGAYYDKVLQPGTCVRIMTGAPIPDGANAVVKYEIVTNLENDGRAPGRVAFSAPTSAGDNIRQKGEEIAAGEVAIKAGEPLSPAGAGLLASCGLSQVEVYKRPRVAVIPIGSELVEPDTLPLPGQIRDGNSYAIGASVVRAGGIPHLHSIVPDDKDMLAAAVLEAVEESDFVVTSGGASNGDFDYIQQVVKEQGELFMDFVNMRPGKAQTFGLVKNTPVFGLSGNPAAAYCGFEMLVRPALRKMQGYATLDRPRVWARLSRDMKKKDSRRIYLRSTLERLDDGSLQVRPAKSQSSGLFSPFQSGNCLAILPEGVPASKKVEAGTLVECLLLDVDEGVVI
ncbi:MAG: molybdopterin molybdotransferase MoeA [Eggerthellaceae bacterium]|nr:molybdopterin molybdotransferase MoeA [Eggerthellaceae bacterium]CDD76848.1 molybdenum cofactor synthesis domain protein [Cryptobacterium sp. CAG:338]